MQLKQRYIYQVVTILLLLIAIKSIDGNLYEWETEEGRVSSYNVSNPFSIRELSKDGIYDLVYFYLEDHYYDEEVEKSSKNLLLVLRCSLAVILIDCIAILVIVFKLNPRWNRLAFLIHGAYIFFLNKNELRVFISEMYHYYNYIFRGWEDRLVISFNLIIGLSCIFLSAMIYNLCYEKNMFKDASVSKNDTKLDVEEVYCQKCGTRYKANIRFCPKCGAKIESED